MSPTAPRRYLAVILPMLPSERLIRDRRAGGPFALVAKQRGAMRLVAVDRIAHALGILPGLTLADARARVPELAAYDANPLADAALLDRLADGCERYTPMLAIAPPDGLILDISGCTHLVDGGEQGLVADLLHRLHRFGLTASHALAATPDAAAALARHGGSDVRQLPVATLELSEDVHTALTRAGLKRIGDLVGRSSASLAARFGIDLPVRLARLLGHEDRRITPRRPPPDIAIEARFAEPISRTTDVLATIAGLVDEAAVLLSERGAGGRRFAVALFRSDGHIARLAIETAQPVRDAALLDRLLRERIDSLSDPLDPGFGYDLIRLDVPLIQPMHVEQPALERDRAVTVALTGLIDRLIVRLGNDRVRCFIAGDSHIPERAAGDQSMVAAPPALPWPAPTSGEPPRRPTHMLDPPQPVEVVYALPEGPPYQFKWRGTLRRIVRHEGPERIAAEWWRRKGGEMPGSGGLTRDYYRVEDSDGHRYWLFRHGLFGEQPRPVWYIHGLLP